MIAHTNGPYGWVRCVRWVCFSRTPQIYFSHGVTGSNPPDPPNPPGRLGKCNEGAHTISRLTALNHYVFGEFLLVGQVSEVAGRESLLASPYSSGTEHAFSDLVGGGG